MGPGKHRYDPSIRYKKGFSPDETHMSGKTSRRTLVLELGIGLACVVNIVIFGLFSIT